MNNDEHKARTIEELTNLAFQGAIEGPSMEELQEPSSDDIESLDEQSTNPSPDFPSTPPIQNNQTLDYLNKSTPSPINQQNTPENQINQNKQSYQQNQTTQNTNTPVVDNKLKQVYMITPAKKRHFLLPILIIFIFIGLAAVYVIRYTDILTMFASNEIKENELNNIIENKKVLYSQTDDKVFFMQFAKVEDKYNMILKGAQYVESTNGLYPSGIIVQYKTTLNDGKLTNEDKQITIEKKAGKYHLTILDEDLKDIYGDFKIIDLYNDSCHYPTYSKKYVGMYTSRDKDKVDFSIYYSGNDRYCVSGYVKVGEKKYILYDYISIEDNKGVTEDGKMVFQFSNDKLTISSTRPNSDMINGTYTLKIVDRCQVIYNEIKELGSIGSEEYEGVLR